jgi:hypothetical protein
VHHRIEVSVRGTDNSVSGGGIRIVYPDYNNPSIPTILTVPTDGTIDVRITNPPPTGENPVTVSNQVSRKLAGALDATYVIIGTTSVNGTYSDQSVASGQEYTYRVRGVSGTGAVGGWSAESTATAALAGMWISIPNEPAYGTIQFPLGGVGRQESADIAKTTQQFVGREYPITDFGTAKVQALAIQTQILGPGENDTIAAGQPTANSRQVAAARRLGSDPVVILYRDQRGRKMYATVSGFSMVDIEQGSYDVTMTLNRVDYDESIV